MSIAVILIAIMNAFVFWSGTLVTYLAPRSIAFGYRVSEDFDRDALFRPFNRVFDIAAVLAFIATLALPYTLGALISLLALPLMAVMWFRFRTQVHPVETDGVITGSVTDDSANIVDVPAFSLHAYWLSLVAIGATIAFIGAHWAEIPDTFASHFNASFQPDAWQTKSITGVFALSFLGIYLVLLMGGAVLPLTRIPIYARTDPSEAGKKATGAALAATATAMGWFSLGIIICMSLAQLATVLPAIHWLLRPAIIGTLIVSIAGSIAMIAYILAKVDKARAGQPRHSVYRRDNQYYKGGMFYNNPDDPAVLVDKRDGIGVDFNYAHAPAKIYLGALLLLCCAPLLLVFL